MVSNEQVKIKAMATIRNILEKNEEPVKFSFLTLYISETFGLGQLFIKKYILNLEDLEYVVFDKVKNTVLWINR